MAAYVVGMSILSIVPSLFFEGGGPLPIDPTTTGCAEPLAALFDDLEGRAEGPWTRVAHGGGKEWLADWDRRYASLPKDCGALEGTRQRLQVQRQNLERLIESYHEDLEPRGRRIRQALEASDAARKP